MLMPDADPKDPAKRALKVKLLLFMVTSALSQLNKSGEPTMAKLVAESPDRIYQWIVEGGPSAYLRMKAGKSKAGVVISTAPPARRCGPPSPPQTRTRLVGVVSTQPS